jgi:glycosyltransferase involved in cell wall biosynthesis
LGERRLFPSEKVVVVPNGLDVERFSRASLHFDRKDFCRRLKIPEDRFLIGTIGEITRLKGHEDFVRAAALIVTRVPDAHFIIAGEDHSGTGENEASLRKLIEDHGLKDRVQRFGWLDNLPELYCALDVLVSASHTESFGLVIAEAMASGTVVVATATDGARELIKDGVNGKIVPIANPDAMMAAVVDLAKHPEERKRYEKVAAACAREKFGLERMIEETEQVYRDALSGA